EREEVAVRGLGDLRDRLRDAVVVVRALFVRRVDLGDDHDLAVRARERRGQRQLADALRRQAEGLAIKVERLERGGERDSGVRGVEDLAQEARGILAEDLEAEAFRR